ncbi:hypothetical protein VitviT2T_017960 [Vitis vinifera]|uniref:Terpene synthase 9 n=3 Tax=Vitis vinifera TaxID=29760 RepID=A0ABY9CW18_VITVI|nr:hypothetical protein VitviT2T_017960 [Vitis vinifera]|eukprot:XP_002275273.1 PREDICTED: probable terpene synthase 9 [Vitis vinifera]
MELTLASLSPLAFGAVNCRKIFALAPPRMRIKQGRSELPYLTITSKIDELQVTERRSANYHPSIWDPKFIESLSTPYTSDDFSNRLEDLKEEAKRLIKDARDTSSRLELIDSIQRLGVAYHLEEEIKEAIDLVHLDDTTTYDLFTTALRFRLLRQHGYSISSDVFDKFRSKDGRFMDGISQDIAGLLSLYEASHLGVEGEDDLEEARRFSTMHLKGLVGNLEGDLADQVQQSLEVPLHWRMPRLEARNFIDIYQRRNTKNSALLELAKLDYNLVQSVYQKELKELTRWWTDLGFKENLSFSRDRLMENYLWSMGFTPEPHFSKCRIGLTKFICIFSAVDDMYDIYGSPDELRRFTDAVNRWDIEALEDLPEYMKICYLATYNFANEMVYDALKDHGLNILPYIRNQWVNLCAAYSIEMQWFYSGHKPSIDEYLGNAWTSVGGPGMMTHVYLLMDCVTKGNLNDCLDQASNLFYWSSFITRLSDDLGTSSAEIARGDVAKSIECFMIEKHISEEQARDQVGQLISHSWKKLNEESAKSSLPKSAINSTLNMARTAQCIFQVGGGIGTSTGVTEDRLTSFIIKPFDI